MKNKNTRDKGKNQDYEHPERAPRRWGRNWWGDWPVGGEEIRYKTDKETGKKVYWEDNGERHIRIIHTGQIVRKDKAQKFIDRIRDQVFLDNV